MSSLGNNEELAIKAEEIIIAHGEKNEGGSSEVTLPDSAEVQYLETLLPEIGLSIRRVYEKGDIFEIADSTIERYAA